MKNFFGLSLLILVFTSTSSIAGGVFCRECPPESINCIPLCGSGKDQQGSLELEKLLAEVFDGSASAQTIVSSQGPASFCGEG